MAVVQSPAEVAKDVEDLEKEAAKWSDKGKTLDIVYQKKWSEYSLINQAMWEGAKEIEEQTKALVEARAVFAKMTTKIEGLRKELGTTGKLARDMQAELGKSVPKFKASAQDVEKLLAINKTSSLLKEAKKTCETRIKALESLINTLETDAQDCEGPPKTPAMPDLPK